MTEPTARTPVCPRCGTRYPERRFTLCPRCLGEADDLPARIGESIELQSEIGRGGMGSVWKGRHLRLGRTVAVKFLAEGLAGEPEFVRRLEREAQALARLDHQGIVAVHDFGEDDGRTYIVMEYVDGRPLSALLPLGAAHAREVALQILDALASAHAAGVVHRDVKPDNVLVEASGRVKVSDFGIARLRDPEDAGWTVTGAGQGVGTPSYMAPEAIAGAAPDPRMDVFSAGVLLYEMVTGRRPVGDFAPLDGPLDRIVRKALAPDPERRYQSAAEMRADLAALDAAPEPDVPPDERQWLRAAALVHTLATAAALWALLVSVTPRVIPPDAVEPLVMLAAETLPDGRLVSRARFETGPTLAAVAAVVLAVATQGLLRRHWRLGRLDQPQPNRSVPESRTVLALGVVAGVVYGLRALLEAAGVTLPSAYIPILGGLIELAVLYCCWIAVLEAWRTRRPLRHEPRLFLGIGIALVPPVLDLIGYLSAWRP